MYDEKCSICTVYLHAATDGGEAQRVQHQEAAADGDARGAYAWRGWEMRAGTCGNVISTPTIACGKVRGGASLKVEGKLAL